MKPTLTSPIDSVQRPVSDVYKKRERSKGLPLFLFFILLLAFSVAGCGLFSTRDPEDPVGSTSNQDLALRAEDVLSQFQASILLRDPDQYIILIDETFIHIATPSAYQNPSFFAEWNTSNEETFIRTLYNGTILPSDSLIEFERFETLHEELWADSAYFRQGYRIAMHPVSSELPTVLEGQMDITVKRGNDNGWRIFRWIDDASGENATFSTLKALL